MKIAHRLQHLHEIITAHNLDDPQLSKLIEQVSFDVQEIERQIQIMTEAGASLSKKQDQKRTMEIILTSSRQLTNADGGTLYMINEHYSDNVITPGKIVERHLDFEILQNETMNVFLKRDTEDFLLPPVPLEISGKMNFNNVSTYCALTGQVVNIEDVYDAKGFDFSGTKNYDEQTGYRSKSMLVIPLRDHEFQIIGVMQLINRKDQHGKIIPFTENDLAIVQAMSYQAAVTLTTKRLVTEQIELFNSFVEVLAAGLGEKSPYNYGHIKRVAKLTVSLADSVNKHDHGIYKNIHFDAEQLDEMHLAGWMHDIGKLTTPENIVSKQVKLEIIEDRFELVVERYNSKIKDLEIKALQEENKALREGKSETFIKEIHKLKRKEMKSLVKELQFLNKCNFGGEFLAQDLINRIYTSHEDTTLEYITPIWKDITGLSRICEVKFNSKPKTAPLLAKVEADFLAIQKGTLSNEERKVINDHADRSWRWLFSLPFPRKMKWLPLYAAAHHETLDGTGYPIGLKADELPIQARIIAISDIFEALTASDRPYKQPMMLSKAIDILGAMVKNGFLDAEILKVFLDSGMYLEWAEEHVDPSQIDVENIDIEKWMKIYYPQNFKNSLPFYQQILFQKDVDDI